MEGCAYSLQYISSQTPGQVGLEVFWFGYFVASGKDQLLLGPIPFCPPAYLVNVQILAFCPSQKEIHMDLPFLCFCQRVCTFVVTLYLNNLRQ